MRKQWRSKTNAPRYVAHFMLIVGKFADAMQLRLTARLVAEATGNDVPQNIRNSNDDTLDNNVHDFIKKYFVGKGLISQRIKFDLNDIKVVSSEFVKILTTFFPKAQSAMYSKLLGRYERTQDRMFAAMSLVALEYKTSALLSTYNRSRRRFVEMALYIQMHQTRRKSQISINWLESDYFRICGKLTQFTNVYPSLLGKVDDLFVVDNQSCSKYGKLFGICRPPFIDRLFSINSNKLSVIIQLIFTAATFDVGNLLMMVGNVVYIFVEALFIDSMSHDDKLLGRKIDWLIAKKDEWIYKKSEQKLSHKVQKLDRKLAAAQPLQYFGKHASPVAYAHMYGGGRIKRLSPRKRNDQQRK
jgi:hypothetical protein